MTKAKVFSSLIKPFTGIGIGNIPFIRKAYQVITPYLLGGKNKIINFGSFKMQITPNKHVDDVITLFIANGSYEPITTQVFKKLLVAGDVVVDAGANIGYFSLLSASIVGTTGKVLAFEPEPNNMATLQQNIAINNFSNIYPYQYALSDHVGRDRFYISANDPAHSLVKSKLHISSIFVNVEKLDNFIPSGQVKLIKVDTEGNELSVLKGAENVIKRSREINLIVEISPSRMSSPAITCINELWEYVKSLDMNNFHIINDYNKSITPCYNTIELEKASNNPDLYVNLLCTR